MGIKKRAKQSAEKMAQEAADAEIQTSPLYNREQKKLAHQKQIEDKLEQFQKECSEGFQILIKNIENILWGEEKQKFLAEMASLLQKVDSEEKLEAYIPSLEKGKTWREILDISPFFMTSLYRSALDIFNAGNYTEAVPCFASLAWLDSKQYAYLAALGFSLFHLKRYDEALYAYFAAAPFAPDTTLFLYLAECYQSMGKKEKAKLCLEAGLEEEKSMATPNKELVKVFQKKYQST